MCKFWLYKIHISLKKDKNTPFLVSSPSFFPGHTQKPSHSTGSHPSPPELRAAGSYARTASPSSASEHRASSITALPHGTHSSSSFQRTAAGHNSHLRSWHRSSICLPAATFLSGVISKTLVQISRQSNTRFRNWGLLPLEGCNWKCWNITDLRKCFTKEKHKC